MLLIEGRFDAHKVAHKVKFRYQPLDNIQKVMVYTKTKHGYKIGYKRSRVIVKKIERK